eukprot:gb/GFBE01075182.1/.p1 GENE.gb/GFBE01075182.1/~~gb/GFBE01075182.1/.p1  ORF type:complete len:286 (+),score=56.50 gb/GFBE01075182.1/:1-858(+)
MAVQALDASAEPLHIHQAISALESAFHAAMPVPAAELRAAERRLAILLAKVQGQLSAFPAGAPHADVYRGNFLEFATCAPTHSPESWYTYPWASAANDFADFDDFESRRASGRFEAWPDHVSSAHAQSWPVSSTGSRSDCSASRAEREGLLRAGLLADLPPAEAFLPDARQHPGDTFQDFRRWARRLGAADLRRAASLLDAAERRSIFRFLQEICERKLYSAQGRQQLAALIATDTWTSGTGINVRQMKQLTLAAGDGSSTPFHEPSFTLQKAPKAAFQLRLGGS